MDKRRLLARLSDNAYHSGADLAREFGVSRTVIWKTIKGLRALGLTVTARRGKGYQLQDKLALLDEALLRAELGEAAADCRIEVTFSTASTSQRLTERLDQAASPADFHANVVLAECQRGGRGRRGKSWLSPLGGGVYLSLGWRFEAPPASLNALSLAAGVAVVRALARLEVGGVGLKWPNDLICNGKKLGGILLEARSETGAACNVIIGIGVNLRLPAALMADLDQPVTDLSDCCSRPPEKNRLVARIIQEQLLMLRRVAAGEMGVYLRDWRQLDCLSGRRAALLMPGKTVSGRIRGVDDNGLLLLETVAGVRSFSSGELSVRAVG